MRTPRLNNLGLMATAVTLALLGAVLSPAAAAGPTGESVVTVTKTWTTPSPVSDGTTVVANIDVTNPGPGAAANVTVSDVFDPGLEFVSASATGGGACGAPVTTEGFQRVDCTFANIGAGLTRSITVTFKAHYWGYRTYTRNYRTDERLEIQKAETHVDIESGQIKTATVQCPNNYDILDYSWHLQNVDQDTGDFYDVYLWSSDIDKDSATIQLFNDAAGRAQGKLWALCLKDETNRGNPVVWGNLKKKNNIEVPDGDGGQPRSERPFYAECPLGYTPMAMNISAVNAAGADPDSIYMDDRVVQTGLEADGGRRATIWAIVKDHAKVTLQWRCLKTSVGVKRLWFENVEDTSLAVPVNDRNAQVQITCDHHYKGIVGGWRGGHFNGSEPRPKTRVYWLWHDYTVPATVDFEGSLLCLHNRLRRGGKIDKSGNITDFLHNHARGTSGGGSAWIAPSEAPDMEVKQTS